MKGGKSSCSLGHRLVDDHLITELSVVSCVARSLADTSFSSHYSSHVHKIKRTMESKPLKFQSNKIENYNLYFSITEQALQKSNISADGPDEIHYNPSTCISFVCSFEKYNSIWESGSPLPSWREAVVAHVRSQESHKLQGHRSNQLSLQDHGTHGKRATDVGPFIRRPVWIS